MMSDQVIEFSTRNMRRSGLVDANFPLVCKDSFWVQNRNNIRLLESQGMVSRGDSRVTKWPAVHGYADAAKRPPGWSESGLTGVKTFHQATLDPYLRVHALKLFNG